MTEILKGQELFVESINLVNKELGHEAFYAVILGSDQAKKKFIRKLMRLVEQYRLTSQVRFVDACKNANSLQNFKYNNIFTGCPEAFGRVAGGPINGKTCYCKQYRRFK